MYKRTMRDNTQIFLVKIIGKLFNFLVREIGKFCLPYKRNIFIFLIYIAGVHIHTKYMYCTYSTGKVH